MQIPITKVEFDECEEKALMEVLRSGWIMQGPKVAEFEKTFASYVGTKEAVAVSSCTTALHLALSILGIGSNDEVIVPSLSFIATANAVLYCGATPRFTDIDPRTYNIDPESISAVINYRTKAIISVDQIGLPADYSRICAVASKHGIPVLSDSACSIGALYHGKRTGSLSLLSCFSFHPRKIITTGEGGMITTDDANFAAKLRILRSQGMSRSTFERQGKTASAEVFSELGYNYRMTDLQAAIGIEQLKKLDGLIQRRRQLAIRYSDAFKHLTGVLIPIEPENIFHTYQSYMIRITPEAAKGRDEVLASLLDEGIGAKMSVQAIHLEPLYRSKFKDVKLPVTEQVFREGLILPLYPSMSAKEQDFIIKKMESLLASKGK